MRKQLRVEATLAEMDAVMPWGRWVSLIKPFYTSRYLFDCETMLRIYCIQKWNNLSDPEMEETLYDRLSYQKFVGLDGFTDPVPDESTILRFRHLLEDHDIDKVIFADTLAYLAELGLVLKRGTIMDATLFEAPVSKKHTAGERDPEMSSTKKKNRKHSGIRAKVEHPFRTFKVVWKHRTLRYKGLAKNATNFTMLCALHNIFCSRKKILALKGG